MTAALWVLVFFALVMLSLFAGVWCGVRGHKKSAIAMEYTAFGCTLGMILCAGLMMQKTGQCLLC